MTMTTHDKTPAGTELGVAAVRLLGAGEGRLGADRLLVLRLVARHGQTGLPVRLDLGLPAADASQLAGVLRRLRLTRRRATAADLPVSDSALRTCGNQAECQSGDDALSAQNGSVKAC